MAVDYLGFAQGVIRNDPTQRGLAQIGAALEAKQERERLAPQEEQAAKLRALQIQQAQMGVDTAAAQQGALAKMGGTLQGAYEQQMMQEQEQQRAAARQKGMETYLNTLKALDGMPNLDPAAKTEIGKHFLKQNPKYAAIAENLSFIDSKGVKAARQFAAGELKDPVTGQPLPAGYYETDGVWTGDATNPVKLTSYKLVQEKPTAEKLQVVEIPTSDGKTAQKFSVDLATGARTPLGAPYAVKSQVTNVNVGGGGLGKPPAGYRWTSGGALEAIPGGPAAQKVGEKGREIEDGKAAIDASIATIDKLLSHPGRQMATGLTSLNPLNLVPGTDAYDFRRELESFDSKLFLSNIQAMKGMGALSNAEGAKVSAAAGAIKPGMSEKAFEANMNTIRAELAKAKARMDGGALLQTPAAPPQTPPKSAASKPAPKLSTRAQKVAERY